MDWSPIVTTALGGALAIIGGFAGQWWGEKKATAREARDRAHEREVWARGLRYEAHVAFLSEYDRRYDQMWIVKQLQQLPGPSEPVPENYLQPLWDRQQAVRLVCTEATARAGERARDALASYTFRDGEWEAVDYERDRYLAAVREEFGLPPVPIMGD
jgi:hypothetical protein